MSDFHLNALTEWISVLDTTALCPENILTKLQTPWVSYYNIFEENSNHLTSHTIITLGLQENCYCQPLDKYIHVFPLDLYVMFSLTSHISFDLTTHLQYFSMRLQMIPKREKFDIHFSTEPWIIKNIMWNVSWGTIILLNPYHWSFMSWMYILYTNPLSQCDWNAWTWVSVIMGVGPGPMPLLRAPWLFWTN